jgi:hypothetical protein
MFLSKSTAVRFIVVMWLVTTVGGVSGVSHAAPPRQDVQPTLPEPKVCTQDGPALAPISEFSPEYIDDQTVLVTYTNPLDQSFSITLSSANPDLLKAYVEGAAICYEAVEVDLGSLVGVAADIGFGDIFLSTLERYANLDELMVLRQEDPELTLLTYFDQQGLPLDEFLNVALESAYGEIDAAVEQGTLLSDVAESLKEDVRTMYADSLETPGIPILPLKEDPDQTLSVEVTLTNGAGINEESYFVFAAVSFGDERQGALSTNVFLRPAMYGYLSRYQCVNNYLAAKFASVYLQVTFGAVSGWVYYGSSYRWYLYDTAGGYPAKSPYIWANRVWVCGWQTSNGYYLWN